MIKITEAIDQVNLGNSVPSKIGEFKIKYIATDGWRGYYEASATKKSGWEKLKDGWVTGNWDDAGDNASDNVEKELNAIDKQANDEGKEMAVIFLPTSNVFSTGYDVFLREKKHGN
jgi:hypothetical protein